MYAGMGRLLQEIGFTGDYRNSYHAERSYWHRGFSPVTRIRYTILEPFLTVSLIHGEQTLKR